jgi:hypothetical protein
MLRSFLRLAKDEKRTADAMVQDDYARLIVMNKPYLPYSPYLA